MVRIAASSIRLSEVPTRNSYSRASRRSVAASFEEMGARRTSGGGTSWGFAAPKQAAGGFVSWG